MSTLTGRIEQVRSRHARQIFNRFKSASVHDGAFRDDATGDMLSPVSRYSSPEEEVGALMAVITLLEFADMTEDQYGQVGALLPTGAPNGILYDAWGPVGDGWRIMDIREAGEASDHHVDEVYLPAVREGGGSEPTRRETTAAHHARAVLRESPPSLLQG